MTTAPVSPLPPQQSHRTVPLPVQILTVIFYAGFAISVSILAMVFFGVIGILVVLALAWQWGRIAALGGTRTSSISCPSRAPQSSGNAHFDAHRAEVLARLEQDQAEFAAFLERLRAARDKAEFDTFMTEHRRPEAG